MEGLAEPGELRRHATCANAQGRRESGLVRVSAGARRMPRRSTDDPFRAPSVSDAPLRSFDDHGLGIEPGNLAAIAACGSTDRCAGARTSISFSPTIVAIAPSRSLRGRRRSLSTAGFPGRRLGGRDGDPRRRSGIQRPQSPETIPFTGAARPNPRRTLPPLSMLGARQKSWFLDRLRSAQATVEAVGKFRRDARLANRLPESAH